MKDEVIEPTRDKEAGQVLHLSITFSSLTNPIPNEIHHRDDNTDSSQHCVDASDLSSTGIIIGTWRMWREDAQGHGERTALLVRDGSAPRFNRDSDNGARAGRKEEQSLTVDLQNNSIKHEEVKRL